jgi:hypothetical protein
MPRVKFTVLNYTISLHRSLAWNLGGQGVVQVASILCTGDSDHRLIVGFQPQNESPSANYYDAGTKNAYLIRPESEFPWYVDLLRNEKPIFAHIDEDRPVFIFLYTGSEPVGEGELRLPR